MAKQTLPTNYIDDILNSSMTGRRRYNLIQNADGTVSLEDVTSYDQVGSDWGAGQINAITGAVNASADASKIIDDLSDIEANTQSGYIGGALAVKQLNRSLQGIPEIITLEGISPSIKHSIVDLFDYPNGFTQDNTIIINVQVYTDNTWWDSWHGLDLFAIPVACVLKQNKIGIRVLDDGLINKHIKVTLMKHLYNT